MVRGAHNQVGPELHNFSTGGGWWWCTHLFGEDGDVLVEGLGGADVTARHPRLPRCAGRQLALLEDKGEQGKQGVAATEQSLLPTRKNC